MVSLQLNLSEEWPRAFSCTVNQCHMKKDNKSTCIGSRLCCDKLRTSGTQDIVRIEAVDSLDVYSLRAVRILIMGGALQAMSCIAMAIARYVERSRIRKRSKREASNLLNTVHGIRTDVVTDMVSGIRKALMAGNIWMLLGMVVIKCAFMTVPAWLGVKHCNFYIMILHISVLDIYVAFGLAFDLYVEVLSETKYTHPCLIQYYWKRAVLYMELILYAAFSYCNLAIAIVSLLVYYDIIPVN